MDDAIAGDPPSRRPVRAPREVASVRDVPHPRRALPARARRRDGHLGEPLVPGLVDPSLMADDRQFSMNLARGLQVLRAFTGDAPILGNREISERTGLPRPTVSRLTYTLVLLGYLSRVQALQKFRLGAGVLSVGHPLLVSLTVRQVARPCMLRLAERTGATVNLGMRDRLNVVYVDTVRADHSNGHLPDIGSSRPLMTTAMGRALLAGADPQERTAILNSLKVHQPATHASELALWQADFERYLACGHTLSTGEWRRDVHAVAVPLRQPAGNDRVALNCTLSAHRLQDGNGIEAFVPMLLEAAHEIETALGLP